MPLKRITLRTSGISVADLHQLRDLARVLGKDQHRVGVFDDVADVLGQQRVVDPDRARTDAGERDIGQDPAVVGVAEDVGLVVLADAEGDEALADPSDVGVEIVPADGVHLAVVEDRPIGGLIAETIDRLFEHVVDVSEIPESPSPVPPKVR